MKGGKKRRGLSEEEALDRMPTARGLSSLSNEKWKYKPKVADELGDHDVHRGPYAEDVQREFGDAVAPGGKMIAKGPMNDTRKQAARELLDEVHALESELKEIASWPA